MAVLRNVVITGLLLRRCSANVRMPMILIGEPMAISMICPNVKCSHFHNFPDEARGQVIRCLRCETQFRIPSRRRIERDPREVREAINSVRVPAGPFVS